MLFSGDPTTRKRVDLGGRSSKERDRQKLVEETKLERKRRYMLRQQNSAALKIQKCYRGRKAAAISKCGIRDHFYRTFGRKCENLNRSCFHPDSDYLRLLLFFIDPRNCNDLSILAETCRMILQISSDGGDAVNIFMVVHSSTKQAVVEYRLKKFTYICIQAAYHNRELFKDQLLATPKAHACPISLLFETVVFLLNPKQRFACMVASMLARRNVFILLKEISLTAKASADYCRTNVELSSLEHILCLMIFHVGDHPCTCSDMALGWSFISQMLTIPSLWELFPNLKEVFSTQGLCRHYINQMAFSIKNKKTALYLHDDSITLPNDISLDHQIFTYLVGNFLETAAIILSQSNCSFELVVDLAFVTTFCLEALSFKMPLNREVERDCEDDMEEPEDSVTRLFPEMKQQVTKALDGRFVLQLVNALLGGSVVSSTAKCSLASTGPYAMGAVCGFLYVAFRILPLERLMTIIAYRTEFVRELWKFMKHCHENKKWPLLHEHLSSIPADAPGWLLPVAVFCPVYKHMLMLVDNEEFYEQEKPLPLNDIKYLIIILRQVLWQLLWLNPLAQTFSSKGGTYNTKRCHVENFKQRVSNVASELLSQLQDWNNRRQFTSSSDFHADGVDESFISQAIIEGTKANDILKRAPFLIPFTSRVKIFNSQLSVARQRNSEHGSFTRNRFRIRRDHILEDAYHQMSALSEDDLKGLIRVTFINEFGVEEAGIDGGGIFKDFMENITRAAFDVQYGLFKETADHLLYPNPASGMIHEQHLQYFHFLGTLLAKAMFEGILVDIPFATFFLSKLKQKFNYLNDLPSLDPELYRHLIFLKHYQGDISDLELYFVIVNNEYGQQSEEELVPSGKNIRVTHENMIQFIHLVSNHRLNFQIRQQSSHFLRGFQQLIQKEWIDMFDEHELQLLISGSLDSLDIDDLRAHANYAGGYHSGHYVIDMFWEVVKTFSPSNQKLFLKFVTGCSRGPLLGFKYLEPCFCIQRASGSATEEALERLPTSATCMNLLKLPPYKSKEQLETKLLYAINADAGFDLS